jgi:hypothetical protein
MVVNLSIHHDSVVATAHGQTDMIAINDIEPCLPQRNGEFAAGIRIRKGLLIRPAMRQPRQIGFIEAGIDTSENSTHDSLNDCEPIRRISIERVPPSC